MSFSALWIWACCYSICRNLFFYDQNNGFKINWLCLSMKMSRSNESAEKFQWHWVNLYLSSEICIQICNERCLLLLTIPCWCTKSQWNSLYKHKHANCIALLCSVLFIAIRAVRTARVELMFAQELVNCSWLGILSRFYDSHGKMCVELKNVCHINWRERNKQANEWTSQFVWRR